MLIYYFQYIIVLIISFLSSIRKKNKIIYILTFFCLVLLPAFRGKNVDRDFSVYNYYFSNILNINYTEKFYYFEPINFIIPFLLSQFIDQYYLVHISLTILAFLGVYLKLKSFRISNSFFLSVAIYLTNFYLLHEWTQVRSGIATGIFLLSIPFILKKKFSSYFFCILLACCFHYSSILYLPLYYLNGFKLNKAFWIGGLLIIILLNIIGLNIFNIPLISTIPKIQAYNELMKDGVFNELNIWSNLGFLINLLLGLFIVYRSDFLKNYNKYIYILVKIHIISIVLYLVLAPLPAVATRASQMLGVVNLCLFPVIIFAFREKWIPYTLIILVSITYFYNHYFRVKLLNDYISWL